MAFQDHYDHVIVGAGSAGCVLANRLSANPRKSVLLLEAGPPDHNPFLKIPAGISKVYVHPRLNWGYMTEAEPQLNGRRLYWPRGKTLGGSSSINGMIYIRGQARDYDDWEAAGNPGWGWKDVLPLYREMESHEDGGNEWHGDNGPLAITHPRFRHAMSDAFLEGCQAAGYPLTSDFNGAEQEGAGYYDFTIRNGIRSSSASAFLAPVRSRPNLTVVTGAQAQRILLNGRQACGVIALHRGENRTFRASEVILCGGAINSPQLLMLSGIGPAEELRALGIEVVHDLPGVGRNLHDHLLVQHLVQVAPHHSINRQMRGPRLVPEVLRYLLKRDGLLTIGASQAAAFLKTDPTLDRPDIQLMFKPYTIEMSPSEKIVPGTIPGWTTAASPLRPKSRGWLKLRSADWREQPSMQPNFLDDPDDARLMVEGVRIMRRIFATAPLAGIAKETLPGTEVQDDAEMLDYVRRNSGSVFHPVGTCKMGADPMAVVDPRLKVAGIEGLRVADASIMPSIVSGNTNAASMMIGAKAGVIIGEER